MNFEAQMFSNFRMTHIRIDLQHHELQRSLSCLRASLVTMENTYTTALMAYVFTLAGDMESRTHLLQRLDRVAVTDGGFPFWTNRDPLSQRFGISHFPFLQEVYSTGPKRQMKCQPLCQWRSVHMWSWLNSATLHPRRIWATPPALSDGSSGSRTITGVSLRPRYDPNKSTWGEPVHRRTAHWKKKDSPQSMR